MERIVRRDDPTVEGIKWDLSPDIHAVKIVSELELPQELVIRIVNCTLRRFVAFEEGLRAFEFDKKKKYRLTSLHFRPILHDFFKYYLNGYKDNREESVPYKLKVDTLTQIMGDWNGKYLPVRGNYPMIQIRQVQENLAFIARERTQITKEGVQFNLKEVDILDKDSKSIDFKRLLAV